LFADGKQLVPPVALALARLVTGNSKSAVFLDFFIGHLSFSGAMVNYGADDGAGQADLDYAGEAHGFVWARFGVAGRQQGAVARL
jgi:hypothetical protein